MKKLLSLFLTLILLAALFAACSTNPDATEPPSAAPTDAPTDAPTQPPVETEPPTEPEPTQKGMESLQDLINQQLENQKNETEPEEPTEAPTEPEPTEPQVVTLGDHTELLVDDFLIESSENITFGREIPVEHECVYVFDGEYEGVWSAYHTIMENPKTGEIWMYYRGLDDYEGDPEQTQYTCLAISKDGIHFEPAVLEDGTNVVIQHKTASHNFAPFYDTNPNCKPGEEFKAVGSARAKVPGGRVEEVLIAFYSPDGIHWTQYDDVIIHNGLYDSLNTVFWDEIHQEYRIYGRYWHGGDHQEYEGIRAIQCQTSQDFLTWSEPIYNTYNGGNAPEYAFYTNSIRPVPGAENFYVGIPMRFNEYRQIVMDHFTHGISDCVMITSRDGHDWFLPDGTPWIYPGIDERDWTDRNFMVSAGIVDMNDEFNIYVQKHYRWDNNGVYRYTVPKNRLGYVYSQNGTITTKPFVMEGTECLTFNYKTSAMGTMKITVLDESGNVLDTYNRELYGNELEYELKMSTKTGRTLQLVIELQDAYLYAIGGR